MSTNLGRLNFQSAMSPGLGFPLAQAPLQGSMPLLVPVRGQMQGDVDIGACGYRQYVPPPQTVRSSSALTLHRASSNDRYQQSSHRAGQPLGAVLGPSMLSPRRGLNRSPATSGMVSSPSAPVPNSDFFSAREGEEASFAPPKMMVSPRRMVSTGSVNLKVSANMPRRFTSVPDVAQHCALPSSTQLAKPDFDQDENDVAIPVGGTATLPSSINAPVGDPYAHDHGPPEVCLEDDFREDCMRHHERHSPEKLKKSQELEQLELINEIRRLEVAVEEEKKRSQEEKMWRIQLQESFAAELLTQKNAHSRDVNKLEGSVSKVLQENQRLSGLVEQLLSRMAATSSGKASEPTDAVPESSTSGGTGSACDLLTPSQPEAVCDRFLRESMAATGGADDVAVAAKSPSGKTGSPVGRLQCGIVSKTIYNPAPKPSGSQVEIRLRSSMYSHVD